jgi:hypothetical protein
MIYQGKFHLLLEKGKVMMAALWLISESSFICLEQLMHHPEMVTEMERFGLVLSRSYGKHSDLEILVDMKPLGKSF